MKLNEINWNHNDKEIGYQGMKLGLGPHGSILSKSSMTMTSTVSFYSHSLDQNHIFGHLPSMSLGIVNHFSHLSIWARDLLS